MTSVRSSPERRFPEEPGDFARDVERLETLKSHVAQARATCGPAHAPEFDPAKPTTGVGLGLKMGMDLTVATLIGFGLGALLDWPLGTFPLLALILCFIGFSAGVRMVLEAAQTYRRQLDIDTRPDQPSSGPGKYQHTDAGSAHN